MPVASAEPPGAHAYRAFGLAVHSELALPELGAPGGGAPAPRVDVRRGAVPSELPDALWRGPFHEGRPGTIRIEVPGVARYLVEGGARITVEALEGDEDSVRLFLLGSAFGALLHQRGLLVMHATTIEVDGAGVMFSGRSGAGKSTLAHAFQQAGHRVVADDVTAIELRGGAPVAIPGFPRIKLWRDAMRELGTPEEGHPRIRPALAKFNVPLEDGHLDAAVPVERMYVLRPGAGAEVAVHPLTGQARFHAVRRQTYRPRYVDALGTRNEHFGWCARFASQVRVAAVTRPTDGFRMPDLMAALRADWRS